MALGTVMKFIATKLAISWFQAALASYAVRQNHDSSVNSFKLHASYLQLESMHCGRIHTYVHVH